MHVYAIQVVGLWLLEWWLTGQLGWCVFSCGGGNDDNDDGDDRKTDIVASIARDAHSLANILHTTHTRHDRDVNELQFMTLAYRRCAITTRMCCGAKQYNILCVCIDKTDAENPLALKRVTRTHTRTRTRDMCRTVCRTGNGSGALCDKGSTPGLKRGVDPNRFIKPLKDTFVWWQA